MAYDVEVAGIRLVDIDEVDARSYVELGKAILVDVCAS